MNELLSYTVIGIFTGAAYAIAASGLVLTYSTTRVFNIAHGAVGMVFAFVFWDFSQNQGMPQWLALILVLLVVAPAIGFLLQRVAVRDLGNAPVGVSLAVTVGILVALIGVAQQIWEPAPRTLPPFFGDKTFTLPGDIVITAHQVITIALSVVVAILLYVLLSRTRIGTSMRASVDNPELLRLYGGRPQLVAGLSWAVGTSLGALAGILLAPVVGLGYFELTLLVITAYAAAMLGKLTNLPLTYIGAMALGLAQSYVVGYLDKLPFRLDEVTGLPAVMPTVFLFAILVLLPQVPLRIGQVKGLVSAPVPSFAKTGVWSVIGVAGIAVLAATRPDSSLLNVGTAIGFGIVMLSLVLLSGYGGFVSLAQVTFAGVGAVAYSKLDEHNLYGLLVAAVIAGVVGALVAIPVLRLTGLYLALATLAFAQLMDKLIFNASWAYEIGNPLIAGRPGILGKNFEDTGDYVVLMSVFFVLIAFVVIAVRRGRVGRMLIAMRDSQAACGTLGLDLRWMRVGLFAGSAMIAGLGGALIAGMRGTTVANDWIFFNSLLLMLMAVVWGVTTVTGAVLGGAFMMYLPVAQSDNPDIAGLLFVVLGVGAILLARNPNGLANYMFQAPRFVMDRVYPALAERFPGMALRQPGDDDEPLDDTTVIPAVDADYDGEVDDVVAAR